MNYLPNLTQISDALGWAVLHSLWQGALAAVLVWAFRSVTRESSADTRYMFSFVTLCVLLAAFIGTFLYYFGLASAGAEIGANIEQTITFPLPDTITPQIVGNPLLRVTDYTSLVGAVWATCFALLGVRYLSAFRLTNKLRTTGLTDLPNEWSTCFKTLAKRSGVSEKVRGYISEHVSSPITFGFWKPIVLMPAWFFTGLTPEQCEAVLLHEFAHIRRHDYVANIVQILVKTVLFYHPAVQYISKMIDIDREHACDDFAVLVTNNPEMLAKALGIIRINAARGGGVFSLSADGPEAPLMHRLKRLMGAPVKKTHSGSGRGYAATLMAVIAGTTLLGLGATESLAHPHKQDAEILAGAATTNLKAWGSGINEKITVNGETYKATSFDFQNDGNGTDIINGKPYPSKYAYSVYAKNGQSYVVKQKNGKQYMEIGDNWYRVDDKKSTNYTYSHTIIQGRKYKTKTDTAKNQTFIKVDGKWYDIDETNLDRLIPTPTVAPAPPASPKYTYTYAYQNGQKYKVKTKNKTGKTYIKIGDNWKNAQTSGGGDHGHRHIKIDGKWVNIDSQNHSNSHVTSFNDGKMTIITSEDGTTSIGFDGGRDSTDNDYLYGYVSMDDKFHLIRTQPKSGKSYAKFGNAWVHVKNKWQEGKPTPSKVNINNTWYSLMQDVHADTVMPTPPTPNNYWINEEARQRVEEAVEREVEAAVRQQEAVVRHAETAMRAEEALIRADEIRERDQERAEAKLERTFARAERDRERAEEKREAAFERAEYQRELVEEQAEKQREIAHQQNHRYEEMRGKLTAQLKKDGYLKSGNSKVTMDMTSTDIFINGKKLADSAEGKYCDIVSKYGLRKEGKKRIVIKPGYFHVKVNGKHNNSTYTHND